MLESTNGNTIRNGWSAEQEIRMLEADQKELLVTFASLGLSIAGLVTGFGEAADAANAALFYSTGHPILGTLSGLSALPIPVIEQALGLTVGSCLLVKVVWLGGRIIKNAIVIATKTKFAKPFILFCQKTGHFFKCIYEKGRTSIKAIQYEVLHNNMRPGYINLGAEITANGSKILFQKLIDAMKKIASWFKNQWAKLDTKTLVPYSSKQNKTFASKPSSNSIFEVDSGFNAENLNQARKNMNNYHTFIKTQPNIYQNKLYPR